MKGIVRHRSDITMNPLGGGVERSVLAYDDPLMAVEVSFETGSEGAPHTHLEPSVWKKVCCWMYSRPSGMIF